MIFIAILPRQIDRLAIMSVLSPPLPAFFCCVRTYAVVSPPLHMYDTFVHFSLDAYIFMITVFPLFYVAFRNKNVKHDNYRFVLFFC